MSNIFVAIKLAIAAIQATLNQRFSVESQKGVTIIEYALIAALIAVVAIAMLTNIGAAVLNIFTQINAAL